MFGMLYSIDGYFVTDVLEQSAIPTFVHKDAPLGHPEDQRLQSSSIFYCDIP
jgi:hypothetical protein